MAMTRKNYREFAEDVKRALVDCNYGGGDGKDSVAALARLMAATMKEDNSRFRYDTFFEACGLDENGHVAAGESEFYTTQFPMGDE